MDVLMAAMQATINASQIPTIALATSPPPPATPPSVVLDENGNPKEVEVVIVTAPRVDEYKHLQAYGGATGAEENDGRNYQFAMSSPEERARALGMNPFASHDLGKDETVSNYGEVVAYSSDVEIDSKWSEIDDALLRTVQLAPVPPSSFFARPPLGPLPRQLWQPGEVPTLPVPGIARGLPPRGVEPPTTGPLTRGPASRPSEVAKGGESLFDPKGGEWRWFPGDARHRPHWDHNPHNAPNSQWQNILPSTTSIIVTA